MKPRHEAKAPPSSKPGLGKATTPKPSSGKDNTDAGAKKPLRNPDFGNTALNTPQKPQAPHPKQDQSPQVQQESRQGQQRRNDDRGIISLEPTSRLCFKSLPQEMTEDQLRQKITIETKQAGAKNNGPVVQVTECRIVRTSDGKSRRMAFVGFKTVEQAKIAQFYWHRAYMGPTRVTAEFAHPPGNQSIPRAWSKYSQGSSAYKETHPEAEGEKDEPTVDTHRKYADAVAMAPAGSAMKSAGFIGQALQHTMTPSDKSALTKEEIQRRKQLKALQYHPALYALSREEREKVLNDPRFFEFIQLSLSRRSKDHKFWDNDDQSLETKSLRAVYLAAMEAQGKASQTQVQANNDESYESLMKELKKSRPGEFSDSDDDDDDVNDIDMAPMSNTDEKKTDSTNSNPEDQEAMRNMIQNILKSNKANSKNLSDADYFKSLQTSNFDDDTEDEEQEEDNAEEEDGEEDSGSASLGVRRRHGHGRKDGSEADDFEDETKSRTPEVNSKRVQLDMDPEELVMETGRLFFRNLSYLVTEDELEELCKQFGRVAEVHVPRDLMRQGKGFAYVLFMLPEDAKQAWKALDKTLFQGRIIHVMPAQPKPESEEGGPAKPRSAADVLAAMGDDELDAMSYKKKKQLMREATAETSKESWNTLFISQDTIANAVAAKFNISRAEMLGADAAEEKDSIAVRMAIAETHVLQETKAYLESQGVVLDAFTAFARQGGAQLERSNRVILIKNIPFDTQEAELQRPFARFGKVLRLILPPYRTMAIVEYEDPKEAKKAFTALAYKKFKNVPLYLEWAPANALTRRTVIQVSDLDESTTTPAKESLSEKFAAIANEMLAAAEKRAREQEEEFERTAPRALFVKNLHFLTREPALREAFVRLVSAAWKAHVIALQQRGRAIPSSDQEWRVRSVSIAKRKKDPKEESKPSPDGMLSLGYGFVEFSHAAAAQAVANAIVAQRGLELDGHLLEVKLSQRSGAGTEAATRIAAAETIATGGGVRKQTSILEEKGVLTQEKLKQQERWSQVSSKLIVRNVPFQATVAEIRELFSAFGQIRRCRLPKKTGSDEHRGFAFVDFVTPQEARNAFAALQATHLYGRHLVLEWAAPDETVEELREKAAKSVGRK